MHFLFLNTLSSWGPAIYALIFIAMIVEGDASLFATAFLAHEGILDPAITLIVVYVGVTAGDILWYLLGVRMSGMKGRLAHKIERLAKPFDRQLSSRPVHLIFVSKFTYGIHHAILARAGMLRMNFKRFIEIDLLGNTLWVAVVGGLGYFLSLSLPLLRHYFRFVEVGLFFGLLLFIFLQHRFAERATREMIEQEK